MSLGIGQWLLSLSRNTKRAVMLAADFAFLPLALWSSFALRLAEPFNWEYLRPALPLFGLVPLVGLFIFIRIGLYRAIIRFMGQRAIWSVFYGTVILSLAIYAMAYVLRIEPFPRSIPINFALVALVYIGGSRMLVRYYYHHMVGRFNDRIPVAIYGAGGAGVQLVHALGQSAEYNPVAFIDDSPALRNANVSGRKVYSPDSLEKLTNKYSVQQVFLAVPNATALERKRIVEHLANFPVRVQTIPSMPEIIQGQSVDALAEIGASDLLNRESVAPINRLYKASILGKVVLVTGAGGSIGAEICRQAAANGAAKLILFEANEFALYNIERELSASGHSAILSPILGNVCDRNRLDEVLSSLKVQTLYHAAAYKHVPIVESNMQEGIRNNSLGTQTAALAAIKHGVERFVLISTDKAVRPTNVMGATKRLAEIIVQDLASRSHCTKFGVVRFGNVLGSSGSVVPVFQDQIRSGGPITVTHPDITRYFMTIPEAASLVIQAAALADQGEIFILDMGEPIKILELAKRMAHLAGLEIRSNSKLNYGIEIKITGLRPGEKLHEELTISNRSRKTVHPKIIQALDETVPTSTLSYALERFEVALNRNDLIELQKLLQELVMDYTPKLDEPLASKTGA